MAALIAVRSDDPRSLILLIPSGALVLAWALLVVARVVPPGAESTSWDPDRVGAVTGVLAFGMVCVGIEALDPDRRWSAGAIPAIVLSGLWCLREVLRFRRSVMLRMDDWRRWLVYAGAWGYALAWPVLALFALTV